jgi:hypothetical protein
MKSWPKFYIRLLNVEFLTRTGVADWWDLPKTGVVGNTRTLIINTNSDQIAQMIQQCMAARGLMMR